MNWSVQIDAKLSENGWSFVSEFSLKENLFLATYENLRKHANFFYGRQNQKHEIIVLGGFVKLEYPRFR